MITINKFLIAFLVVAVVVGGYFYFHSRKPNTEISGTQSPDNQNMNQSNPEPSPEPTPTPTPTTPAPTPETPVSETTLAVVETNLGTFEVTLNGKAAPKTVANFTKLSKDGFYNNLTFHRIVQQEGFHLIQGGDPKGDGTGGPGYTVPAEIGLKHTKGAIATARTGDQINPKRDSSGSQFYIVEEDIPYLDGQYTVFGYVTKGMDIVEKIGAVKTGAGDRPIDPVIIKKITIK